MTAIDNPTIFSGLFNRTTQYKPLYMSRKNTPPRGKDNTRIQMAFIDRPEFRNFIDRYF